MSSRNFTASDGGAWNHQNLFVPDLSRVIRKVVEEDFRGATPPGLLSVVFALPSVKSDLHIDLNDMIIKRVLDEIRDRCQVWIDCFGDEGHLIISARKLQHIQKGLQEVREWMLAQSRELEGNDTTLVHRSGDRPRFCIMLRPTQELGLGETITDGWRGVALLGGVKDEESLIPNLLDGFDIVHRDSQEVYDSSITKLLLNAIEQAVRLMRPELGRKYLRIHLGIRSLSKRQTKVKARDQYTTPQFRDLMNSATKRGHVAFRLCFGDENLTKLILRHIHKTDDPEKPTLRRFVALDATIDRLTDVKPRFCLVFFSGNFRIEMDIFVEPTNMCSSRRANRPNLPTASSPRIFRFNKTVDADIVVACPDMAFDWKLSVDSDLSTDNVHNKFRDLAKELRFDQAPEDGQTFPAVHVSRASLRKANIDNVACKAMWTFECVKAPCHIVLTEYHDWDAYPLSSFMEKNPRVAQFSFSPTGRNCPVPNKSCAVSLYGDDWDEKMRNLSPASIKFADQIIDLFGRDLDGEQYVDNLLHEIEFLLGITSHAAAEAESLRAPPQATKEVVPLINTAARAAKDDDCLIDFTD
ncbi:hypothetical protein N0V93_003527 [Gnomoniopsis smithogilvyi]|uniref:Uncharacterized protein n=1 Tax=Gnomoniopsis smithogilvyi TaxID=1191159 RepID=A0A9W8Z0Y1_9PEZI|nr:hypothetical protein N0V93_003527 [Gnomoniopsis smithogilvyi]